MGEVAFGRTMVGKTNSSIARIPMEMREVFIDWFQMGSERPLIPRARMGVGKDSEMLCLIFVAWGLPMLCLKHKEGAWAKRPCHE